MPVYFSEGDGIAMFVGRGGKALHTVEIAGESCTVRETVCSETPARRATSLTDTDFLTAAIGRSFYVDDAIGGTLRSHF